MDAEVVLVRHGETEWSRDGRHTGRTDIPLTERGRLQARAVGAALGGREFARVLTSPLSRAAETCRLAGFGDRAERRDELKEWAPDVRSEKSRPFRAGMRLPESVGW